MEAVEHGGITTPLAAALSTWGRPIVSLSDLLDQANEAAYVVTTAGFAVVMGLGVFFRYALNDSLAWADEVAMIFFVWATFLSIATGYLHGKQVGVHFLVQALPTRWRTPAFFLRESLTGAFLVSLLVTGVEALPLSAGVHTDALRLPSTIPYLAIPTASVLMLVHWLRRNLAEGTWTAGLGKLMCAMAIFSVIVLPLGQHVTLVGAARYWLLAMTFLVPLFLGVPVAFALGLLAMMYISVIATIPFSTGAMQIFFGIEQITYLAIPLLILSGTLMHVAGIAERIVDFAQVLVGRLRGGLGIADILASLIFADMSGSAVSDTAAIGSLVIPEMKKRGYRAEFATALQASAGTLGLMCPPTITLLVYATVIGVSVSRLFAAAILPAVLVAVSFAMVTYMHARRHGYPAERVARGEIMPRIWRALPGLFAGVVVVGGILGGIFTPAEAGVVLLVYVLLVGVTIYRKSVGARRIIRTTIQAGYTSGMTLCLISTSVAVGFLLASDLIPMHIAQYITDLTRDRHMVLLILNLFFIATGILLEPPAVIVAFLPAVMPLLHNVGVDPVLWGVIFVINAGIGMIHPPVGLTLYVSAAIGGVRIERAALAALPFLGIMLVDLALVSLWPNIALILPHLLFGYPLQ
ncbi:MAG TPA: TRAP transporter large permease subunit [Candidatus Methylomirabilis sp.]|nr:TRAP transporter large permease subunit [Candidatus Methylomirabilis sp.]